MTQEDKELLINDLSARLTYGVICQVDDGAAGLNDGKLIEIDISKELVRFNSDYYWDAYIDDIKPYLRPMSSMTDEEKNELSHYDNAVQRTDFFYSHHIDCRFMIEKGLALEAPEGMYKNKRIMLTKELTQQDAMDAAVAKCFEQSEQKPTDKVEPKFKVKKGEWYICTDTFVSKGKIIAIKGQTYQSKQEDDTITCEDNCLFIDRHDGKASDYFRLWTIQDAKDGDVLVDEYNNIGIYKEIEGICWHSYIYLGCDNCLYGFSIGGSHMPNNTTPATKEQRVLLFQKMKEAGYVWDDEKKELKKIEQKSIWSEEDSFQLDAAINIVANSGHTCTSDWLKSFKDRVMNT